MNTGVMEKTEPRAVNSIKVAVKCKHCDRLMFYKLSKTTGVIECKCTKCGRITEVDLSLRMNRSGIKYRVAVRRP